MLNAKSAYVYEIKITLLGMEPPIWRQLLIEKNTSLEELHQNIQDAMGWFDEHLHQFIIGDKFYGPAESEDRMPDEKDEAATDLQKLVRDRVRTFHYEYDFGDGWSHQIEILRRVPFDPSLQYPRCTGGKGACPPEDSGGPLGFSEILQVIKNPDHPEYQTTIDWVGNYDPNKFSPDEATTRLQSIPFDVYHDAVDIIFAKTMEDFLGKCSFCESTVTEDQSTSVGVKIHEEIDLDELGEKVFPFQIGEMENPVLGLIVGRETKAKKDGNDALFQVCSEDCFGNFKKQAMLEVALLSLDELPPGYIEEIFQPGTFA